MASWSVSGSSLAVPGAQWVAVPVAAVRDRALSVWARLLLAALLCRVDRDGLLDGDVGAVGAEIGCYTPALDDAVRELMDAGWIYKEEL